MTDTGVGGEPRDKVLGEPSTAYAPPTHSQPGVRRFGWLMVALAFVELSLSAAFVIGADRAGRAGDWASTLASFGGRSGATIAGVSVLAAMTVGLAVRTHGFCRVRGINVLLYLIAMIGIAAAGAMLATALLLRSISDIHF